MQQIGDKLQTHLIIGIRFAINIGGIHQNTTHKGIIKHLNVSLGLTGSLVQNATAGLIILRRCGHKDVGVGTVGNRMTCLMLL